ncbi:MAG: penicillin-binding transpeptidase domain-containing protein [Patescibacteria group bacterium]
MSKKRTYNHEIDPDEIFLDSHNLPEFDIHQFEGRIERPISKQAVALMGIVFMLVGVVFLGRLMDLQVARGESYRERSENNRLRHIPIFAERGVIYDRNNQEMAYNVPSEDDFSEREYIKQEGFSHVLGYISYPKKDSSGFYYQTAFEGKNGIESTYNDLLEGKQGIKINEVDVFGGVQSESTILPPEDGENIVLSIDARVQSKFYELIGNLSRDVSFTGGAGIIMNIENGELLALASYPEYSSDVLSRGSDSEKISAYINDPSKPFLNRAVSGLYTPGSTVKPYVGLGALHEGIVTADTSILSTGSISIPNPYFPDLPSIFNDWKAHGWVDMRKAIAVSSNVYFYEIGGGYEDQKGLGIAKIEKYVRMFGLGELTGIDIPGDVEGVVPNPQWKESNFPGDPWKVGDTYHTSIGQYGFQVTPLQMVRAVAAIANDGTLVKPHLLIGISEQPINQEEFIVGTIDIEGKYFNVIKEGMRRAVIEGSATGLNISQVSVAAKSGTAEVGVSKKRVNSWITGFFPYENPKYAFTVVMEEGPRANLIGALYVMRQLLEWMAVETPEYTQ